MRIVWKLFQHSEDVDESLNWPVFSFSFKEENGRFYETDGEKRTKPNNVCPIFIDNIEAEAFWSHRPDFHIV